MQKKTCNGVFLSGLDGYHFLKMCENYSDEEVIIGFQQDIKMDNPDLGAAAAFSQAVNEFEYLQKQSSGNGRCKRVKENMKAQCSSAFSKYALT